MMSKLPNEMRENAFRGDRTTGWEPEYPVQCPGPVYVIDRSWHRSTWVGMFTSAGLTMLIGMAMLWGVYNYGAAASWIGGG